MSKPTLTSFAIAAGIAGLVTVGLPAAAASGAPSAKPAVGDPCLIGTWHDNAGTTSTLWNHKKVVMHAGGADIDHINAAGIDHDNWRRSKRLVGTSAGYKLVEHIRGVNTEKMVASGSDDKRKLKVTEQGWAKHSTNKYIYNGHHYTGYLNQSGHSTARYRCTAKTLTWLTHKGKVRGTETRTSRKP
jgi:hypothetical protein